MKNEEQVVYLNLPTPERKPYIKIIKSLAAQYDMALDWDKIKQQDIKELERIIQMIERIYKTR